MRPWKLNIRRGHINIHLWRTVAFPHSDGFLVQFSNLQSCIPNREVIEVVSLVCFLSILIKYRVYQKKFALIFFNFVARQPKWERPQQAKRQNAFVFSLCPSGAPVSCCWGLPLPAWPFKAIFWDTLYKWRLRTHGWFRKTLSVTTLTRSSSKMMPFLMSAG